MDEIIKKAMLDAAAAAAAAESVKEEMDAAAAKVAAEAEAEEAAKVAKAEERTALAQRVLDIFMAVPEVEGDGGDGEAPTAEVTEEQATESQMALKEAVATSKREAMVGADEEQKNAFALEVLTLLIETPPADGEDAALTQEQVDEAKALTPEPDPVVDEETPAGGDAEAQRMETRRLRLDGDAEAPEDGDAAVEPEPLPSRSRCLSPPPTRSSPISSRLAR